MIEHAEPDIVEAAAPFLPAWAALAAAEHLRVPRWAGGADVAAGRLPATGFQAVLVEPFNIAAMVSGLEG